MPIFDKFVNPLADEVTIHAPFAVNEGRRLLLHYEVANDLSEPIYLVNRIAVWTWQGLSLDPNRVYTEVVGDLLRLSKALVPIPPGVDGGEADVPYFSEVAPGGIFVEVLELALPLEPFHPYDAIIGQDDVHNFDQVELVVGWLASSDVDIHLVQGQADEILIAADQEQVRRHQQLLTMTLPVSVPAFFAPAEEALS